MNKQFSHFIRVPYAHVDKMGIVYYANYFIYFEMARSELLRECKIPYTEMENKGVMLPVIKAYCEYKKSACYDDYIKVESICSFHGVKLRIDYKIKRDTTVLVEGYTEHVCMSKENKILKPDSTMINLLTK